MSFSPSTTFDRTCNLLRGTMKVCCHPCTHYSMLCFNTDITVVACESPSVPSSLSVLSEQLFDEPRKRAVHGQRRIGSPVGVGLGTSAGLVSHVKRVASGMGLPYLHTIENITNIDIFIECAHILGDIPVPGYRKGLPGVRPYFSEPNCQQKAAVTSNSNFTATSFTIWRDLMVLKTVGGFISQSNYPKRPQRSTPQHYQVRQPPLSFSHHAIC